MSAEPKWTESDTWYRCGADDGKGLRFCPEADLARVSEGWKLALAPAPESGPLSWENQQLRAQFTELEGLCLSEPVTVSIKCGVAEGCDRGAVICCSPRQGYNRGGAIGRRHQAKTAHQTIEHSGATAPNVGTSARSMQDGNGSYARLLL